MMLKSKVGYIRVKGGKVWYRIVGSGSLKPPLLVLHGGPGLPSNSIQVLDKLSEYNRTIVFYDQLGCGKSDRPKDNKLWTLARFLDELNTVQDTLGLKNFYILGHSWGSILAVEYALLKPKILKGLILSGPVLSVSKWISDANRLIDDMPSKTKKIIKKHEAVGSINSKEYEGAALEFDKKHYCRIYPYPQPIQEGQKGKNIDTYKIMWGPSEFHCTGNLKGYDITNRLHLIKIPVLLTCGKYDMATPKTIRYYKSFFPNANMHVFDNSAHVPYVEETSNYIETIKHFLDTHN